MGTIMIIGGIAIAINFMILVVKLIKKRYADFILDTLVSTGMLVFLAGTLTGTGIAIVGGMVFSLFALFIPDLSKKIIDSVKPDNNTFHN